MKYIGIDHHKQYFIATVVDKEGNVLDKMKVSTDRRSIREYFKGISSEGGVKAVMEAGFNWGYLFDEIRGYVQEIKLAHPLKTRAIAEARIKTDSIDSEVLAHLLRTDFVAEAYAPDIETRDRRNLLRYRASLMKIRTMIKNMVHAVLARNHIEEEEFKALSDKFGKRGRAYMRRMTFRGNDSAILNHYLDIIEEIEGKIRWADEKIKESFKEDETCKLLKSIPGIGELFAVLVRYEIDNIERFPTSGHLCSYAGLVPSTYSSGGKTYHGRITRQGNRWLRWAMTEAAQVAIVKDLRLKLFHRKISLRGGKKKANIAVARKLLKIVYRVWKERRAYYVK